MINVIGLGYIGLPTALMLASHGQRIVGTDYNESLVSTLKAGRTTFKEDGLEELFYNAIAGGIEFSTEYQRTNQYIISVPTPYNERNKRVDAKYVIEAVRSVLEVCEKGAILVIESTISPNTINREIRPVIESAGLVIGTDIHLVHAPERIIPGKMVYELIHNSRTIGADDMDIGFRIKELYSCFCKGEIIVTDIRTAEMTKVVENTYRDINIAYANELAKICRSDDMDVYEIIRIANKHPRVNILMPGPGVGGHCISVDPWFLVGDYPGLANIILSARKINDSMPEFVLERIRDIMKEKGLKDLSRVGFYGLTYKENVDDIRESPTLQMLESMDKHLCHNMIQIYDPYIKEDIVPNQCHDLDDFLNKSDMVVLLVGHDEIKANMDKLKGKVILDTRNICHIEGVYRI